MPEKLFSSVKGGCDVELLSTGLDRLDRIMGGGVEPAAVTLLYGEAGTGKTNICLLLARNAALNEKKTIFIDTEGVSLQRFRQICGAQFEEVMKRMLFSEPYDLKEQTNLILKSIKLLSSNMIGLLVVDSLTMHFRMSRNEEYDERKELNEQLRLLLGASRKYSIPVAVTSQVYTDISTGEVEPLGGHAIMHAAKTIIRLEKTENGGRKATLIKHRHMEEGSSCFFRIVAGGLE